MTMSWVEIILYSAIALGLWYYMTDMLGVMLRGGRRPDVDDGD